MRQLLVLKITLLENEKGITTVLTRTGNFATLHCQPVMRGVRPTVGGVDTLHSFQAAIEEYQTIYDRAVELYHVFEDAEIGELQSRREELDRLVERFLNVSGLEWDDCGSLGRHLRFLKYYLDRHDKDACYSDIKNIVFSDLPVCLYNLVRRNPEDSYLDEKLKISVMPLIQGAHYDSAIRKAFVVLTDRLRDTFGIADDIDGEELVNTVFGGKGKLQVSLDESKRQSYRNLFSGFYGVYRNKYAHADVYPTLAEVKAVIEMVNSLLSEIESMASRFLEEGA